MGLLPLLPGCHEPLNQKIHASPCTYVACNWAFNGHVMAAELFLCYIPEPTNTQVLWWLPNMKNFASLSLSFYIFLYTFSPIHIYIYTNIYTYMYNTYIVYIHTYIYIDCGEALYNSGPWLLLSLTAPASRLQVDLAQSLRILDVL